MAENLTEFFFIINIVKNIEEIGFSSFFCNTNRPNNSHIYAVASSLGEGVLLWAANKLSNYLHFADFFTRPYSSDAYEITCDWLNIWIRNEKKKNTLVQGCNCRSWTVALPKPPLLVDGNLIHVPTNRIFRTSRWLSLHRMSNIGYNR